MSKKELPQTLQPKYLLESGPESLIKQWEIFITQYLGPKFVTNFRKNLAKWHEYYGNRIDDSLVFNLALEESAKTTFREFLSDTYYEFNKREDTGIQPFYEEVHAIEVAKFEEFLRTLETKFRSSINPIPEIIIKKIIKLMGMYLSRVRDSKKSETDKILTIIRNTDRVLASVSDYIFKKISINSTL